jgi:hypothetical protein
MKLPPVVAIPEQSRADLDLEHRRVVAVLGVVEAPSVPERRSAHCAYVIAGFEHRVGHLLVVQTRPSSAPLAAQASVTQGSLRDREDVQPKGGGFTVRFRGEITVEVRRPHRSLVAGVPIVARSVCP